MKTKKKTCKHLWIIWGWYLVSGRIYPDGYVCQKCLERRVSACDK